VPTDTTNYNGLPGLSAGNFVINKATPTATLAVSNSPQTYTGSGQSATVGISSSSVPGAVANILTGGAATQTNAGTYAVTADFVPTDTTNYNGLPGLSAGNFVINKANATVVVTPYNVTYDINPHTATVASITGVNGETGATVGTVTLNTTHTDAGTYNTDSWSFVGTANYNNIASTTITDVINKAGLTITASNQTKECGTVLSFDTTSPSPDFTVAGLLGTTDSVTSVSLTSAGAAASAPACASPGPTYPITVSAAAGNGLANYNISYVSGTLTVVDTTPPAISSLTPAGGQLLALGTQASVTANFSDSCSVASVTYCWDDSSPDTVLSGANLASQTTATAIHTYASAGVYTVTVKVTDGCGNAVDQKYQFAVVYDPSAGFVTGGGWISSGAGAYVPNPVLVGKANFGFSSQYKKGAQVPTGETEFQFQVADVNFHSTAYQWLVVSGAKGQYKGTGTLNGVAGYGFLLTATDGQIAGGGGTDKFRIKITNSAGVIVYDNVPGGVDDIDNANPQAIGGGSIVIHK
jgi:hypothetical protein